MNKLKELRKVYNLKQEDLVKVLYSSQKQISLYETGKRKLNEDQIRVICKHYKISADWLLGIDEE
jgi:transcriptional regulator with XRE-family HTH domain